MGCARPNRFDDAGEDVLMMNLYRIISPTPTLPRLRERGQTCAARAQGDYTMRGKTF